MKIRHHLTRAIKVPDTQKVYGAQVVGVKLVGSVVVYEWAIFARKPRKPKKKARVSLSKGKVEKRGD